MTLCTQPRPGLQWRKGLLVHAYEETEAQSQGPTDIEGLKAVTLPGALSSTVPRAGNKEQLAIGE